MIKTRRDALATLGIMGLASAVPQLIKRAQASSPLDAASPRFHVDALERAFTAAGVSSHRLEWWRAAKLGMFIHWDPSSLAGTEISWSRKGSKPLDSSGDPPGMSKIPSTIISTRSSIQLILTPTNGCRSLAAGEPDIS